MIARARIVAWMLGLVALTLTANVRVASAQDAAAEPQTRDETDVQDLWRRLRHHPPAAPKADEPPSFFVVAPSFSSKPSTGVMLGANATMIFVNGNHDTTHLSSASANAKVSVRKQATSGFQFGIFTSDDRWFLQGDNRAQWTSLDTYAIGAGSVASSATNLEYTWFRLYDSAYRQVAPRLFAGGGINISDHARVHTDEVPIAPTAYGEYSTAHGFDATGQVSSGVNVGLLVDTRDNVVNASRGWLASASYRMFFAGFLGGSSSWQELSTDVRTYRRMSPRQTLAFWFLGDLVTTGSAPYFELPTVGGDLRERSSRGYAQGRYHGPHLLYGEIEYRATVTPSGLFGIVVFANTATLDGAPGQRLFASYAPGAGAGVRVLLDKDSHTNLAVDYGWGRDGSSGLYLGIQETF
jgi:hypothetical protein